MLCVVGHDCACCWHDSFRNYVIKHTLLDVLSWNVVSHVESGDYLDNPLMWQYEHGKIPVHCVLPISVYCFGYQLESHGRHFLNEHMILWSG